MFSPENLITSLIDALNELKVLADTQRIQLQEKDKIIDGLNFGMAEYRESERHKDEELKNCRIGSDSLRIRLHELERSIVNKNNAIIKLTTDLKDCREKCDELKKELDEKEMKNARPSNFVYPHPDIKKLNLKYDESDNYWIYDSPDKFVFRPYQIAGNYILVCIGVRNLDGKLSSLYDDSFNFPKLLQISKQKKVKITHLKHVWEGMDIDLFTSLQKKGLANF
jgi:hypothetical protein